MKEKPHKKSNQKASIVLLAGFLGSGKTTLLKRILSWETDLSDTVVLVNEFGDIGIDGALLKDSASDVIELTSGCICCTLSADLRRSLEKIWKRFHPQRIFIESSGVADPAAVVSALTDPLLTRSMRIDKILTVLDADFWEAREAFGPLFFNQLEKADLILLNKIDTQEKEKIAVYLKEMHEVLSGTQIVPTIQCNIDPATLWAEKARKDRFERAPVHLFKETLPEMGDSHTSGQHDHHQHLDEMHREEEHGEEGHGDHNGHHTSHFVTFSFASDKVVKESCFRKFVDGLPFELFRLKGPVKFEDRSVLINFVGGKSEWTPWEGEPDTRLAFIGWTVDEAAILNQLKECIID